MRSLRDCIWHQSTNNGRKNSEDDLEIEDDDDDIISGCGSVKGARNYAGMAASACANTLMAQQSALLKQLRGKTREEARAEAERAKVIDRREGHLRKPKKDRNNYR